MAGFRERLETVRGRLEAAARRAGRPPEGVRPVAVTKMVEPERIREAMLAGQTLFGENRVQEARGKAAEIGEGPEWHLIGHLQRNKAKDAARLFRMIHSVDSEELLRELARHASTRPEPLEVLVQVDLAGESSKHGAKENDIPGILSAASGLASVSVVGLMILPPYDPDPEKSRFYFRRLAELARRIGRERFEKVGMRELSMGMSEDFEVAVEEGATLVRIGRALFGERPPRPGKEIG